LEVINNANNEVVHTCYGNNGLYTTRDLSWLGIDLARASTSAELQPNRASQIFNYIAGVSKSALIVQTEIIQSNQNRALTPEDLQVIASAFLTKADAVYKLHATLGHLPYSRIERMILKGIMKGYTFDVNLIKQMMKVKCDICMRAKITDSSHKGTLFNSDKPWHTFSFDITGPFQQRSIHGNFYMSALMDTTSKFVFDDYLQDKDEVHDKISWFLDNYITALRGRTGATYEIMLLSDLGEAHSNKIINTCRKFGVLKQTTARYTPDHNAFSEHFFRTVGEMSRCQLLQFNLEEELWQDSRSHAVWLLNRVPVTKYAPNQS
jgi:hypothetical protein